MKNIKSVLALIMAVCLMLCLAVPAFATEGSIVNENPAAQETVSSGTFENTSADGGKDAHLEVCTELLAGQC